MNECIDLYSRLIIATLTIVGPIIIALLSSFNEGEKRRKDLATHTKEELGKQAVKEVHTNPDRIRETVDKTSEGYKKIDKETQTELKRLNPLVQFWNIYGFLAFSFLCLILFFLIKKNQWGLYNHNFCLMVFLLSLIAYLVSLFFIVRVFYTIIKTKRLI